jgi:Chaperone of endosialidase
MKSYVFALAALAAIGFSGAAFAGDAATAPKAMSDSDLDKVTAGNGFGPGFGTLTADGHTPNVSHSNFGIGKARDASDRFVGAGQCTAGREVCFASDRRLKRDIKQVARLDNGLGLYRYRYNWSDQVYVGVMAQEVALVRPDAVVRGADGYLRVDYSRLGLHLMTWQEWMASKLKTAENATSTAPKAMSDSEMDKVTAAGPPEQLQRGVVTANSAGGNSVNALPGRSIAEDHAGREVGQGIETAGK